MDHSNIHRVYSTATVRDTPVVVTCTLQLMNRAIQKLSVPRGPIKLKVSPCRDTCVCAQKYFSYYLSERRPLFLPFWRLALGFETKLFNKSSENHCPVGDFLPFPLMFFLCGSVYRVGLISIFTRQHQIPPKLVAIIATMEKILDDPIS